MRGVVNRSPSTFGLLLLASVLPLCCACLCFGSSNKDKVSEDSRVLASATHEEITATITYTRTNAYGKQYVDQFGKDDFRTTTESLSLRFKPKVIKRKTLLIQSNRTGTITMPSPSAQLEFSDQGDRIAYRANDQPWRLLFVMHGGTLLPAPSDFLQGKPDWNEVPSLDEQTYLTLYLARDFTQGPAFNHIEQNLVLDHILHTHGEARLLSFLLTLLAHPSKPSTLTLKDAYKKLSPPTQDTFINTLIEAINPESMTTEQINALADFIEVRDPRIEHLVLPMARHYSALSSEELGSTYRSKLVAELLLQAARQDLDVSAKLATRALNAKHSALVTRPGGPLRLAMLAIIAAHGTPVEAVSSMVSQTPCEHGYLNDDGILHSSAELEAIVQTHIAEGPIKSMYIQPRVDGQFVLAALVLTGQPVPALLTSLTCP